MTEQQQHRNNNNNNKSTFLDLSGAKLRRRQAQSLQESAAAPPSQIARQQLERMGWTDGTGLGKHRTGMTTHIRVTRRPDQAGLGGVSATTAQGNDDEWWKDCLGDALAKLGNSKKRKKSKRQHTTDEELFQATGGARFGMRAAPTQNLAKWRRTEQVIDQTKTTTALAADGVLKKKEEEDDDSQKKKKSKGKKSEKKKSKDEKKKKKKKRKKDVTGEA